MPFFNGGNVCNETQINPFYSSNDVLDYTFFNVDEQDALDEDTDENE